VHRSSNQDNFAGVGKPSESYLGFSNMHEIWISSIPTIMDLKYTNYYNAHEMIAIHVNYNRGSSGGGR
jgi:hypothetical protein